MSNRFSIFARMKGIPNGALIAAIIVTSLVFLWLEPNFGTVNNLRNVLVQTAPLIITAVGMTFVIMTSGIDLSVGAVLLLSGALMGVASGSGTSVLATIGIVLLVALAGGLVNGLVVGVIRAPAMIATLASMFVIRGVGGHITKQQGIQISPALQGLGTGQLLGIPVPVIVGILVVVVGWLVLTRTVFGRYVQAIGSSEKAARNAGVPVEWVLVATYLLAAAFFGIGALVQLGRLGAVQPTVGLGYEMTVITAVVLGGASLFGGSGSIQGTALGALFVVIIENGLVLSGASPYVFDAVRGTVLLVAVLGADWGKVQRAIVRARRSEPQATPVTAK